MVSATAASLLYQPQLATDLPELGVIPFGHAQVTVRAWLDVRYSTHDNAPVAEVSWEGVDEGDQRSGRGRAMSKSDGSLAGHILFHNGDGSAFTCGPR